MAIGTAYVVSPVLATAKVVVLFSSGMAGETGFRNRFCWFVFERDDLCRITFFRVGLSWSMTRLTSSHSVFPSLQATKLGVGSGDKILELIFMAVFAGVAPYIIVLFGCSASGNITGKHPPEERK